MYGFYKKGKNFQGTRTQFFNPNFVKEDINLLEQIQRKVLVRK